MQRLAFPAAASQSPANYAQLRPPTHDRPKKKRNALNCGGVSPASTGGHPPWRRRSEPPFFSRASSPPPKRDPVRVRLDWGAARIRGYPNKQNLSRIRSSTTSFDNESLLDHVHRPAMGF